MEECTQITLDEWSQWKEDIRRKLQEVTEDFVYIGYRLKQIKESGMFDGCKDVIEFAKKEYGLDQATTYRFMAINTRFSEDGNSIELKQDFKGISSSKLAEMLALPDSECMLITEKNTVKDIRDLKRFNKQEIPDADVREVQTPLQKCIIDYFADKKRKEMLETAMELITKGEWEPAAAVINPGENQTHKKGIVFLFMYEWNIGIKYKLMTQPEPIAMTWAEFMHEIHTIYIESAGAEKGVWCEFYGIDLEQENVDKTQENQVVEGIFATSRKTQNSDVKKAESESKIETKTEVKPAVKAPDQENIAPEYKQIGSEQDDNPLSCKFDSEARCLIASKESCTNDNNSSCMYLSGLSMDEETESEVVPVQQENEESATDALNTNTQNQSEDNDTLKMNVYLSNNEPDQSAGIRLHSESMPPTQTSGISEEILEGEVIDNQEEGIKELLGKLFDNADLIESEQAAVDWLSKQDRNIAENLVYAFEKADFRAIY